jgi:hypothetical protein
MKDEALRLALEALRHFEKAGLATLKTIDAITAIKQALEQSVADSNTSKEPVAKIEKTQHEPFAWYVDFGNDDEPNYFSKTKPDELRALVIPLYTAPPKRKPLTDEEIYELWEDHVVPVFGNPVVFARVIEAAHGIKGEA